MYTKMNIVNQTKEKKEIVSMRVIESSRENHEEVTVESKTEDYRDIVRWGKPDHPSPNGGLAYLL